MTLERTGGFAGLLCAATYIFGFVFLISLIKFPFGSKILTLYFFCLKENNYNL